jgi:hypothetical protein
MLPALHGRFVIDSNAFMSKLVNRKKSKDGSEYNRNVAKEFSQNGKYIHQFTMEDDKAIKQLMMISSHKRSLAPQKLCPDAQSSNTSKIHFHTLDIGKSETNSFNKCSKSIVQLFERLRLQTKKSDRKHLHKSHQIALQVLELEIPNLCKPETVLRKKIHQKVPTALPMVQQSKSQQYLSCKNMTIEILPHIKRRTPATKRRKRVEATTTEEVERSNISVEQMIRDLGDYERIRRRKAEISLMKQHVLRQFRSCPNLHNLLVPQTDPQSIVAKLDDSDTNFLLENHRDEDICAWLDD